MITYIFKETYEYHNKIDKNVADSFSQTIYLQK